MSDTEGIPRNYNDSQEYSAHKMFSRIWDCCYCCILHKKHNHNHE